MLRPLEVGYDSKRRDDKGRVLQQGEWQEPSGRYRYKYTDSLGKRKYYIVGD